MNQKSSARRDRRRKAPEQSPRSINATLSRLQSTQSHEELSEPTLAVDQARFNTALIGIAIDEALRAQPPRRRSQLARLHYKPEPPAVLPAPKKSLFKVLLRVLLRLVRLTIILAVVALVLLGIKASNDWFAAHFHYGVQTTPYRPYPVARDVIVDQALPDGRVVKARYKGHVPSVRELPPIANSQTGDMWYSEKDGNCWVLTTLTPTSFVIGWVDP